jgi:hypothetical protein
MHPARLAAPLAALIVLVGILAACTATDPRLDDEIAPTPPASGVASPLRHERVVIVSGADMTLAADQSVDLFIIYGGTARIEGQASSIMVVNGTANLVGAHADGVVAIRSQVTIDPASTVSGDIRTVESEVLGATATTVTGTVHDFGVEMLLSWRNLAPILALIYVAFAVSVLMAGVVVAGLAGRQVRAAGALIANEPALVLGAGVVGLVVLVMVGILAMITIVGIPFAVGLLGVVLPGLFVIGYIVTGIWFGEQVLQRSSPVTRDRPYLAAVIGLTIVGLVSFLPPIGGLISFVGFGAVMLLSWRVLRGARGAAPYAAGVGTVTEAAS